MLITDQVATAPCTDPIQAARINPGPPPVMMSRNRRGLSLLLLRHPDLQHLFAGVACLLHSYISPRVLSLLVATPRRLQGKRILMEFPLRLCAFA